MRTLFFLLTSWAVLGFSVQEDWDSDLEFQTPYEEIVEKADPNAEPYISAYYPPDSVQMKSDPIFLSTIMASDPKLNRRTMFIQKDGGFEALETGFYRIALLQKFQNIRVGGQISCDMWVKSGSSSYLKHTEDFYVEKGKNQTFLTTRILRMNKGDNLCLLFNSNPYPVDVQLSGHSSNSSLVMERLNP